MTEYNYDRFHPSNYDYERFDGPEAGADMLEFELHTLDGKPVFLGDYQDKWLVLETGSLTCPMYVKNINPIKSVIKKYPDVEFLVVYVREAHPGSRQGAHATLAQKLSVARKSRHVYDEIRSVVVDDLDGSMHRAYGSFPNMVYVINPDGVVVYRCDWAFPHLIDQVLGDRPKLHLTERKRIVTAAPWVMVPVTLKGGWDALWDLLIALPGILWGHVKVNFSSSFTDRRS
jgi:hypothetical protein